MAGLDCAANVMGCRMALLSSVLAARRSSTAENTAKNAIGDANMQLHAVEKIPCVQVRRHYQG